MNAYIYIFIYIYVHVHVHVWNLGGTISAANHDFFWGPVQKAIDEDVIWPPKTRILSTKNGELPFGDRAWLGIIRFLREMWAGDFHRLNALDSLEADGAPRCCPPLLRSEASSLVRNGHWRGWHQPNLCFSWQFSGHDGAAARKRPGMTCNIPSGTAALPWSFDATGLCCPCAQA